jgi:uncharacterized protein
MTEATLERLFLLVFSSPFVSDHLTILWHAGEPLVAGLDYFQRAFDIIERLNRNHVRITHSVQTNGTLIDQDWIDFFLQHNMRVGISLDGPPHLNDRYRRARNGVGTFERIIERVRLLQHNDCPFHVITVLTRDSLLAAQELFDFYIQNGITDIAFNIEEVQGEHALSSLQDEGADVIVKTFFRNFLTLIQDHPGKVKIREFTNVFGAIADVAAADYGNPQAEPLRIVTVGVDGALSTFSPELIDLHDCGRYKSFTFGNVNQGDGLSGILTDRNFATVHADIQSGLEKCKASCDYFDLCRGGSPAAKVFENGGFDTTDTIFCRLSKKTLIDVALEHVEARNGIPN